MEQLATTLSKDVDTDMVKVLITASGRGENAVTEAVGAAIDAAFKGDREEEAS